MITYPQNATDWVGNGWHEPTLHTKMTVSRSEYGTHLGYRDVNNRFHLLTQWNDGELTFTWNWDGHEAAFPQYSSDDLIDPRLLKLAQSWLEYLDAVIEKE